VPRARASGDLDGRLGESFLRPFLHNPGAASSGHPPCYDRSVIPRAVSVLGRRDRRRLASVIDDFLPKSAYQSPRRPLEGVHEKQLFFKQLSATPSP